MRYIPLLLLAIYLQLPAKAQDWNKDITPQQKIYTLSKIWKDVTENFAFFSNVPNLNWDSLYQAYIPKALETKTKYDYYRLLERFICSLKDGHTRLYHFRELFPHYKRLTFNGGTIKILPAVFNKRIFITRVGTKETTGIFPLGTEILEVNDQPVQQYLVENVFPYIAASTEHVLWDMGAEELFRGLIDVPEVPTWKVKFRKPGGEVFTKELQLSDGPDNIWYPAYPEFKDLELKWLDNKIAQVSINTFMRDTVITLFRALLPELKSAKAIIIDLRQNGGGNTNIGAAILSYFTNADTLYGSRSKNRINNSYYKATGFFLRNKKELDEQERLMLCHYKNDSWVEGGLMKYRNNTDPQDRLHVPVVVLTSHKTASAAEDFLIMLDGLKGRATTMGQRTNGSTGQPLFATISTGGSYQVCSKKDTYPDGRPFVGVGIIPAIELEPSVEDILSGKDSILAKAIAWLSKKN